MISKEAEKLLQEIIEHESNISYWDKRFEMADHREDTILRGCFKELKDKGLVDAKWADNKPYIISILKDGYLYQQHKEEQIKIEKELTMSDFEIKLTELLERAKAFRDNRRNGVYYERDNIEENVWMDDVQILYSNYLKTHPLSTRIKSLIFQRKFDELVAALTSVSKDVDFIEKINGVTKVEVPKYQAKNLPEYDVFISHANNDKEELIEELYSSLNRLGIKIFYDKESLIWGDEWKKQILNGVSKAEFAIIVISKNFFDREWTEKELAEFLNRQNRNGQKLILPILHNISMKQLKNKYPSIADIQAINSKDYSCDQIALLFANILIKRLKSE